MKYDSNTKNYPSLVAIQPDGDRPPLFCIHPMGGRVHWYSDLVRYLEKDQPVYGLQARGLDDLQPPHCDIDTMAAHYVAEIKSFLPSGPYYLAGYSFGGLVAFEMARQLEYSGEGPTFLTLLDAHGPTYSSSLELAKIQSSQPEDLWRKIMRHLNRLKELPLAEQIFYLSEKLWHRCSESARHNMHQSRKRLSTAVLRSSQILGFALPQAFRDFKSIHRQAHRKYKRACVGAARVYAGRVLLFRATDQGSGLNPERTIGWTNAFTGDLTIHDVPGNHRSIITEPNVKILAQKLRTFMEPAARPNLNPAADDKSLLSKSLLHIG